MGNSLGCGTPEYDERHAKAATDIQSVQRGKKARAEIREKKIAGLRAIFGKLYINLIVISLVNEKNNHVTNETWMLTNRLGAFNPDKLMPEDINAKQFFGQKKDLADGSKYMGQM